MVLLDDVKNLVLYKKPFFLPIDEDDKKRKSLIMLLTPNYQSSINAMNSPYIINRRYFESYYLEKNVYRYINSEGYIENPNNEKYLVNVSESQLSSSDRNNLPDSAFGLPKWRQWPMPDKEHVLLAIRFFNYVEEKFEKELASNITKKIKEFFMEEEVHVTKKNRYYPYWVKDFPELVTEGYIFTKNNLYINFDKFESGETNICFVTGLSGSGKSTLAKNLASKYKAEWIELDVFEYCGDLDDNQLKQAGEIFYDYLSSHKELWERLKKRDIRGKELGKEISKFLKYAISWTAKKDGKYIFEGVQIFQTADLEDIKNKPMIFVNSSMLKSIIQRWKRNGNGKIQLWEELKNEFPEMLRWYIDNEKEFQRFVKAVLNDDPSLLESQQNLNESTDEMEKVDISKRKEIIDQINKSLDTVGLKPHFSKNGQWGTDKFLKGDGSLCLGSFKKEDFNKALDTVRTELKGKCRVSPDNYFTIFVKLNESSVDDEDLAFSYYFADEIKSKFNDTVNMATIDDEVLNEDMTTTNKISVVVTNNKNHILVATDSNGDLIFPNAMEATTEAAFETVTSICTSQLNLRPLEIKYLYDFTYSNKSSAMFKASTYLVRNFDGELVNKTQDYKNVQFMSLEEIVLSNKMGKEVKRFISQYGTNIFRDPTKYILKYVNVSNIVYNGYEPDIYIIKQLLNRDSLFAMFKKCDVSYPKNQITVIVSGNDDVGYIDESNVTVLSKNVFEKQFKEFGYEEYIKFVSTLYVYHTINPNVADTIVQPLAMYKSGVHDKILNDKANHDSKYNVERLFKYIHDTYGDREIIRIVKENKIGILQKYMKEAYRTFGITSVREMTELLTEEDQISTVADIADMGKKITRKIKAASVYKLNKIKRDIDRGNTGTETRAATTLQQLKSGDLIHTPDPSVEDKTTNEAAYIVEGWAKDDYIINENTMYFFEDSINYDTILRQSLYADRIRNSKEVLEIYKNVKADCPFIRYAFTELNRYDNKNIYFDLSYYNESYFRNASDAIGNTNTEKSMKIYKELLQRLINDNRFDNYTKKTIFIPVLDWRHNSSFRMWIYKEDLNPLSIIFNMIKFNPNEVQKLFKNTDLVFMGSGNYFKLNFDQVDISKDQVQQRFIQAIKRIVALGRNNVDPDPEDEPVNSAKAIALDIIDQVEKSQNIEIKSVKPILRATEKDPFADDKISANIAIKKVVGDNTASKPNISQKIILTPKDIVVSDKNPKGNPEDQGATVKNKITTTSITTSKEDIEKSTKIDKLANAVNTPSIDKQKENLVSMIAKASADSNSTEEAIDKLNDDEFKALLLAINAEEEENVKTSNARASRITQLSDQFREKEVSGKSVKDLLAQNPNDMKLPETKLDVASIDDNWSSMTFMNFDKNYDPDSDIVKMLDSMKNWTYPIAVRDINVTDNSSSEDYINLWDIDCEDYKGTRFKLKMDIPKFINDRFLKLRGNKKTLMLQSTLVPIIKTDLDTCQIIGIGGYNKIFVRRYGSGSGKSMPNVDKLIKTLNRYEDSSLKIIKGDNTKICNKYELPVDYIDLASYYNTIENDAFILFFNQDELRTQYEVDDSKGLPLGVYKKSFTGKNQLQDTIIYYDSNIAKDFKTVSSYIGAIINGNVKDIVGFNEIYNSIIATGKKYMYSRASILNIKLPVVVVCAYVEGLTTTLKKAGINYSFKQKLDRQDKLSDAIDYIPFSDGYLIYEISYASTMLMNGLKECDTESYSIKDINSKEMYMDFLTDIGGSLKSDGLDNSYDCMLDPITKEILEIYKLPTDYVSVLLYANVLLADNKFVKHTDVSVKRLRRKELIAGYFYKAITVAYQSYANQIRHTRKSVKMTVKQSAVIDMILSKDPSTSDLSINNAINDVESANSVTSKGLVGMNTDRAYSLDKRGYDDTMLNVLGMSTGFSGNVGINRQATIDCSVQGARGIIVPINGNIEKLGTSKTLTITEALTPFGVNHDDPFRTLMTFIQTSKHMVRTDVSDPLLVTNGSDEAMAYLTSDIFAFKAKKNGKIVEMVENENNRDSYMIVEYNDGSHEFIDLSETVEKNSDGGYSVPMKLSTDLQVGSKVKAGEVIAYDKLSFSNSLGESDNLALNVGTLAKVAIMNTDEGFEDSAACTAEFARKLGTDVIVKKDVTLDKNANIRVLKKVGDQVSEGDILLSHQRSFDDEVANSLLRNLSMNQDELSELGQNPVKSKYTGVLQDIKVYYTADFEELSPSLQQLVKEYEKPIKKTKDIYKKYGLDDATLPPTKKLDNVGKTKNVQDGVLIEFYIKYNDTMAIGDKVVFYSANKGIIKYIIQDGEEPTTDFRPTEHIDAFVSIGSILGRMVCSTVIYGSVAKLMVELDRTCKDMAGIKYDPSKI